MKVPAHLNLVRLTGFGGGAFVRTPAGFHRVQGLPEGYASYAVREGYQAEACPEPHGPDTGCPVCAPFHGVIAVKVQDRRAFAGRRVMDIECECLRIQTILAEASFSTCPRCGRVYRLVDGVWGPGEPPEKNGRAESSGRLATDFEGMARGGRVARASECIEEAIPGFMKAWKAAEKRALRSGGKPRSFSKKTTETSTTARAAKSDRSIRSRLSKDRASGRIGRREP